jgi:hypothetical protein
MDKTSAFLGRELYDKIVISWLKDRNPETTSRNDLSILLGYFGSNEMFKKIGEKLAPGVSLKKFKSLYFENALLHGEAKIQKETWDALDEMISGATSNKRELLKDLFEARRWPWNWALRQRRNDTLIIMVHTWQTIHVDDCYLFNKKRKEYFKLFFEHHPHANGRSRVPLTREFILKVELLNSPRGKRLTHKQFVSFFGNGSFCSDKSTYLDMDEVKEKICECAIEKLTSEIV